MAMMRVRRGAGWLLNALRMPGFMRSAACEERLGIPVEITVGKLFTVIHVRDVKLFFDRVTGRFDGLALEPDDCQRSSKS